MHIPMSATWPGLLSVGTRVWEMPNAPLVSTMDLKCGAIVSGESEIMEKPFFARRRSARRPSPKELGHPATN